MMDELMDELIGWIQKYKPSHAYIRHARAFQRARIIALQTLP
jgi:hypothetical protein